MIVMPTSAEIRQARAHTAELLSSTLRVVHGPALASLGATATVLGRVTEPLAPTLHRVGLGALPEVLASPRPHARDSPFATVDLGVAHGCGPLGHVDYGGVPGQPPVSFRAGVYGELAWRGQHVLHRIRSHQTVIIVLRRGRALITRWNRVVEYCADELHDGSEETLGRVIVRMHQARDRVAAAILAGAYALRAITADTPRLTRCHRHHETPNAPTHDIRRHKPHHTQLANTPGRRLWDTSLCRAVIG